MARSDSREVQLIRSSRGKWGQRGVPHKGWECVEIEDLGTANAICEMCEAQDIRYAHHMQHTNHLDILVVGCVCAGHMEENPTAAQIRDKGMRSRVAKRKRWLSRRWKVSAKGNDWLEADGYRVIVYAKSAGWGATVSAVDDSYVHRSRRVFPNTDQAKLAAFDLVTNLVAKNGRL